MRVSDEIGDALHIILCLSKRRHLAVLRDDAGAGVVAGEREREIAVMLIQAPAIAVAARASARLASSPFGSTPQPARPS